MRERERLARFTDLVRRQSGPLVFALTLLIIGLVMAGLWRRHIVSLTWFKDRKDGIAAVSSVVSTVLLVVGATFTYFRFFRGRTLALRAELQLSATVHPTKEQHLIHAITLKIKNVGGSTIWSPTPLLRLRIFGPEGVSRTSDIEFSEVVGSEAHGSATASFSVVETGETVSFFTVAQVPQAAWTVVYKASLAADSGDIWVAYCSVTNVAKKDAPDTKDKHA